MAEETQTPVESAPGPGCTELPHVAVPAARITPVLGPGGGAW